MDNYLEKNFLEVVLSEEGSSKVWTGRHVELEASYFDGQIEHLSLDIVADTYADFDNGFLGESTPLGKAIIGCAAGDVVAYSGGKVKILSVSLTSAPPPMDAAKRREEVIKKAVNDSNRTNAIMFASSFNGKWGDYDPDSLSDPNELPDRKTTEDNP